MSVNHHTHIHLHLHIPPLIIPEQSIKTYSYRHSYNSEPFDYPELADRTIIEMINSLFHTIKNGVVVKIFEKDGTSFFLEKKSDELKLLQLNNSLVYASDDEDENASKLEYHYDMTELTEQILLFKKIYQPYFDTLPQEFIDFLQEK